MELINQFQAAIIGGDRRQIAVAESLTDLFMKVKIFGHPPSENPTSVEWSKSLAEALEQAKVVLLPIGGMNDAGLIRSYNNEPLIDFGSWLVTLPEGTIVATGSFTSKWLKVAENLKLTVFQYAEDDEIAILNSIPTAEGALQIAMEELPITIHGSSVIVIGLGRVGMTIARAFKALEARVIVAARRKALLARAIEMGCEVIPHESLADVVGSVNLIINTIPAPVLNHNILPRMAAETLIIDLASPPGGTDFALAKQLNIKAILAPGLPGTAAPKTSGAILVRTIPKIIIDLLNNGGGR